MLLTAVFGISACGGRVKLPTNNYEKVRFAFNGVENSLKNGGASAKKTSAGFDRPAGALTVFTASPIAKLFAKKAENDDLSTIYNAMSVEKETADPSFEYDEPPMIQFRYLKAMLEEVGEDFAFGTKYTYTLTGEIYYDFDRRTAPQSEEYRTRYSLDISVKIDIDGNDLITAEVGFDVTYSQNDESRHQQRYSAFVLDYDMNDASPTYTLAMTDIDDLLDYRNENEKYISAEYDYVNVEKNSIREWRKFGVCSPEPLSNDQNDDFAYKYSVLRAYRDNKVYHLQNAFLKDPALKTAVLNGTGLLDEAASFKRFYAEQGTENGKIRTVVDRFNEILGKDIVNSFVYTGATEKWEGGNENHQSDNLFLRAISQKEIQDPTIGQDCALIDLFRPDGGVIFDQKSGSSDYFSIYLKNGEENTVAVYNDLNFNELNVKVRSTAYDKTEWIDVNGSERDTFSSFVARSGFHQAYYENEPEAMTLEFDVSLRSDPNVKLQDPLRVTLRNEGASRRLLNQWSLACKYINAYAPVKDMIPAFEGPEGILYIARVSSNNGSDGKEDAPILSGRIGFVSSGDLSESTAAYKNKLKELGFVENAYNSSYTKRMDDHYVLKLTVFDNGMDFELTAQEKPAESLTDVIKRLIGNGSITIPTFPGDYEYRVEGNVIRIQNNNGSYIGDYISSLGGYGFLVGSCDGYTAAYQFVGGTLYRIREMGYSIAVEKVNVALTLVGDFNGWSQTDESSDLLNVSFGTMGDNICFEKEIGLTVGQGIKILKNHSWANGGYGFNLYSGSPTFDPALYEGDENGNIVVKESGTYTVKVYLGLSMYSANSSENSFDPLMIDIIKKN